MKKCKVCGKSLDKHRTYELMHCLEKDGYIGGDNLVNLSSYVRQLTGRKVRLSISRGETFIGLDGSDLFKPEEGAFVTLAKICLKGEYKEPKSWHDEDDTAEVSSQDSEEES